VSSDEPGARGQDVTAPGHEPGVLEAPARGPGRSAAAVDETGGAGEPARGLLPWPVAAAALLGVLALMLGLGLWANQTLRPGVGVTPAAQLLPTAAAGPARTAAPGAAAAPVASVTALAPSAAVSAVSAATALPTTGRPVAAGSPGASATQAPATPAPAAPPPVSATSPPAPVGAASPSTTAPSPRPTVDPVLAAEVGKAYERYWDVRAEALYNLDTSHLDEVSDGDGRQVIEQALEKLRADGRAVDTRVEHRYRVISVSPDHAEVADQYADKSIYVDPISHEPLGSDTSQTIETVDSLRAKELYEMQKFEDTWKVVKGFVSD